LEKKMPLRNKPAWIEIAEKYIGLQEYPGARNNPTILEWARGLGRFVGMAYTADSTPWCGLFVARTAGLTGVRPACLMQWALSLSVSISEFQITFGFLENQKSNPG